MALSSDQKKHLLIGGGVGALALVAGYALLGGRKAFGLPSGHGDHHGKHHHRHHEDQGEVENERGEYGRKKHKHHHGGHHGE